MQVEYESFKTRARRSEYVAQRFSQLLQGKVLDVGCCEAALRSHLPSGVDYLGIDIAGKPDIQIDLDATERLPFEDNSFDCTVCTDVLEHLDSLHRVFGEILRVSKRHAIISLPNCWVNARQPIQRGHGDFAHYGLPLERPLDRHKWFFSFSEIESFFQGQAARHGLKIIDLFATEKPRPLPLRLLRRMRYPKQPYYLNRYAHTVWCVFEKPEQA